LFLAAVLLLAGAAVAQAPPAPKAPPAAPDKLDGYLLRWEQEMRKVSTFHAQMTRLDKDKAFNTTTKLTGYAQYLKAGTGPTTLNLFLYEMKKEGKADFAEKFVSSGTFLYQFLPAQKEIRAYPLPKPKAGQPADDNFISVLIGMKAQEARRRYILSLAKEDQWYVYVDIVPRFPADRAQFQRARLVLSKSNYLPRQLWFEQVNGNETTWDIPKVQTGVTLDRRSFDAPRPPAGWKLVTMPPNNAGAGPAPARPAPSVVRPAGR
jgi:TIGR03009 family protein